MYLLLLNKIVAFETGFNSREVNLLMNFPQIVLMHLDGLTSRHSTHVLFNVRFEMVAYGMNAQVDLNLYNIDTKST